MIMSLSAVKMAAAGVTAVLASAALVVPAAASAGSWGTAKEVPGIGALASGGFAQITSVSCAAAGNCSAGGFYVDSSGNQQVFVASQVNGTWHTAIEVPGTAALNRGGQAAIGSVSCASAGNCSAGGSYTVSSGHQQVFEAFVASQVNGTWHTAIEVPGTAALNRGGQADVTSVSCASAGNCSAGGYYVGGSGNQQVFVASQVNGTWHTAIEVPGIAALGEAEIASVSCGAAGNCSAGGVYIDSSRHQQAFVVSQVNGTWHTAIEVPGTAALNRGGNAEIDSVSCASAGSCSAGGVYAPRLNRRQVFVVSQVNGTWHTAIEVPGTAALNRGGNAGIGSVSCGAAGNCSAGGSYQDSSGHAQAFVASQVNGTWHTAIEVPGIAALGSAGIASVSCGAAGNCSAGGSYQDSSGHFQVFVVSQVNGTWHTAIEVPGTAALNQGGDARIASVSCAAAGNCSAGGDYTDSSGLGQAFVVSET